MTALLGAACADHDIGQKCEELLDVDPTAGGGNRTETQEVVGQDLQFPCEELICVATNGRDGYCSKKCRLTAPDCSTDDDCDFPDRCVYGKCVDGPQDGNCPDGFECRVVQPRGEFSNQRFCVWKKCAQPSDCGPVEDFCCREVETTNPQENLKLCDFSVDGKCG